MEWSKEGSQEEKAVLPSLLEKDWSEDSGNQEKIKSGIFPSGLQGLKPGKCTRENSEYKGSFPATSLSQFF